MSRFKLKPQRLLSRLGVALAVVGLLCVSYLRAADIPSHGGGYKKLEDKADKYVKDLIRLKNLPGMSIAVSKNGRLLVSKGYGWARKDRKATLMREYSALRIGSVTKATITGPAGFQLMRKKGIDPKKKRLYGRNGIFGNRYQKEIEIALRRYHPIAAMAISANDKVYTWYSNGWVSMGSSTDLKKFTIPIRYSLPSGTKPSDIRGAAISRKGRIYLWIEHTYKVGDKTRSGLGLVEGNWTNLRHIKVNNVKMPSGKSYRHIVAIAIAKSDDKVYVWYEDNTVSCGNSTDFGAHYGPRKMQVIKAGTGYDGNAKLRGVGINKDDQVYYWYSNGNTSAGSSTERGKHVRPRKYHIPTGLKPHEDWAKWYRSITIEHLLKHRSGFTRSGDVPGGAMMFGVSEDRLTYDQLHRHFLRTRKLLDEPGKSYSYSNHGFGLWTLLIERLSGRSYRDYVINHYLKSMGLHRVITPSSANPPSHYAWRHVYENGKPVPVPFKDSGIGLAAGGFLASSRDLAQLTNQLSKKYSITELTQMGWKWYRGNGGYKLSHSGGVTGGTTYVAMFTKGYKSVSGKNLSNVHVVVNTNTDIDVDYLIALTDKLALAVPETKPPSDYDRWNGKLVRGSTTPRKGKAKKKKSGAKRTSPKKNRATRTNPNRATRTNPNRPTRSNPNKAKRTNPKPKTKRRKRPTRRPTGKRKIRGKRQ